MIINIWGLSIYFTPENDCWDAGEDHPNRGWAVVMLLLLIYAMMLFAIFSCLLCCLSVLLCNSENSIASSVKDAATSALTGMTISKGDASKKVEECVICMDKFADDDGKAIV